MTQLLDRIEVVTGDITKLDVDAIVNAANEALLGGGGVDGAIHRAAGSDLLAECRKLSGCPTGMAKITSGYALPANNVIHAVGPVWHGGQHHEEALLASCYKTSLALAAEHHIKSVAFPAISTGVYHFPKDRAANIAVSQTIDWLQSQEQPQKVIFCCFSETDTEVYHQALGSSKVGP